MQDPGCQIVAVYGLAGFVRLRWEFSGSQFKRLADASAVTLVYGLATTGKI